MNVFLSMYHLYFRIDLASLAPVIPGEKETKMEQAKKFEKICSDFLRIPLSRFYSDNARLSQFELKPMYANSVDFD